MHIGCSIDHNWHADVRGLQRFVAAVDDAGFDHVRLSGHLLTARPDRYPGRDNYTYALPFREPFTFFASVAGMTERIRLRTGITALPIQQTVVVAKQSAELCHLSDGRFDLGVGLSWQEAEYRALGHDLQRRGRRIEEQLVVLRRLWTEPFVTFHGEFHDIDDLGLDQLPPLPIPIWLGTSATPPLLSRVARLADGWLSVGPLAGPEPAAMLRAAAAEAGTPVPAVCSRISLAPGTSPDDWLTAASEQVERGATQLSLSTWEVGVEDGLALLLHARRALADAGLVDP